MIAVDLSNDVIIPSGVAIVGALVAGISAVLKSWFENRDARSRGDRKLDLATKRTAFAREWIDISKQLEDDPGTKDKDSESKAVLVERAHKELLQAARETEIAFYDATTDTSSGLLQLRRLLMLVRRRSPASYVVSGLFLFTSVFAWLLVCIPTPGDDGFSIPAAIFVSIVATFVLRVLAGLVVAGLERLAISDSETIADLTVKDNLVTITTKAEHAFSAGQTVMIDASDDRFDGTFKEIGVPNRTNFTFELRSADAHSLPGVTGWVCGDSVKKQMQRLFMIERFSKLNDDQLSTTRRLGARLAGILFLVSIVAISTGVVIGAHDRYKREVHKVCIGDPYDGTYFGIDDYVHDAEYNPDVAAAQALISSAPPWSNDWLTFALEDPVLNSEDTYFDSDYLQKDQFDPSGTQEEWETFTISDTKGEKYFLDYYGLRYKDKSTVLFRRFGDSGLKPIGDPCTPQSLQVSITDAPFLEAAGVVGNVLLPGSLETGDFVPGYYDDDSGRFVPIDLTSVDDPSEMDDQAYDALLYRFNERLFEYYDDSSITGLSWISLNTTGSLVDSKQIKAYFGRDGRLIPVCDNVRYPEISPCLEQSDAYYDSGLDSAVWWAFLAGLVILLGSIVSRLIFGWIANRFDPPEAKHSNGEGGEPTAPGPAEDLAAAKPEDLLSSRP